MIQKFRLSKDEKQKEALPDPKIKEKYTWQDCGCSAASFISPDMRENKV